MRLQVLSRDWILSNVFIVGLETSMLVSLLIVQRPLVNCLVLRSILQEIIYISQSELTEESRGETCDSDKSSSELRRNLVEEAGATPNIS